MVDLSLQLQCYANAGMSQVLCQRLRERVFHALTDSPSPSKSPLTQRESLVLVRARDTAGVRCRAWPMVFCTTEAQRKKYNSETNSQ